MKQDAKPRRPQVYPELRVHLQQPSPSSPRQRRVDRQPPGTPPCPAMAPHGTQQRVVSDAGKPRHSWTVNTDFLSELKTDLLDTYGLNRLKG